MRLAVKLTPNAAANRIQGVAQDEAGEIYLKIAVTAVPEDGKANAALIAFLAKFLRIPKSAIHLQSGASQRRKILSIAADHALLQQRFLKEGISL